MESIYHYRQLFRFFGANTLFHRTGVWAVRNTTGMQCDHTTRYILTAHEIAIHIIQHFITVDVAVVVRRRYCLRMVIEQTRTERTHHIVITLKGLVYGRRLVYTAGNRLKIVNAESKRITITVPPYNIKRMVPIMQVV